MEVWKDIEGYEGYYQISNQGKVLSLNYCLRGYSALLTPKINKRGYAWVELRKNGTRKPMLIHRLVAQAFIENPNNYPLINHKDENPLNNNADNLEWCTHSYNVKYSLALHPERCKRGGYIRHRKNGAYKCSKKVRQIDISSGKIICEYNYLAEIKRVLGKNEYSIRECCYGNRKTAYGYRWEFCE